MIAASCAFWAAAYAAGHFDWERGGQRALLMLGFALAAVGIGARAPIGPAEPGRRAPPAHDRGAFQLGLVVLAMALTWHVATCVRALEAPRVIDIAVATLRAGYALRHGMSPYAVPLDPRPDLAEVGLNAASYSGFKYLPMMAVAYLPFEWAGGVGGLLVANLLWAIALAAVVYAIGNRCAGPACGVWAAALFLSIPFGPSELYRQGITDLVSILPCAMALLWSESSPGLAGFAAGLSISTKLLPGPIALLAALPRERRGRYAIGCGVGLLPVAAFLVWTPREMISNAVGFSGVVYTDSTSWLHQKPPGLVRAVRWLCAGGILAAAVHVWRAPRIGLVRRIAIYVVATIAVVLSGPISHRNYLLWWLPLCGVLVCCAVIERRGNPPR